MGKLRARLQFRLLLQIRRNSIRRNLGYYVQVAPHLYCGPLEAAANIQIATCSPNFLIQESIETFGGFYGEVLKEPIQWQDGFIIPPTKPGLGIELNEEVAERHAYEGGVFPELVDTPITGL